MGASSSHICGYQSDAAAVLSEDVDIPQQDKVLYGQNASKLEDPPSSSTAASDDGRTLGGRPTTMTSYDESGVSSIEENSPRAGFGGAGEIVRQALFRAAELMEEFDVLEAETVLAEALHELDGNQEACDKLRQSQIFTQVHDRVAQYDAICGMLNNPHMNTLWENEDGKFELYQTEGTWFDYKMTLNIDAPLSECLSTGHELELVPKAQPMVIGTPQRLGEYGKYFLVTLMKLSVVFFRVELLFEISRFRNKTFGFLAESIRSSFPANGRKIPEKGWRTVRPWVYTANVWMPKGGGQPGTTLVQVTRVDCGLNVPQFVLNFVFRNLASGFMADLRKSAAKAKDPASPWAEAIKKDAEGLYADLRDLEDAAHKRRPVTAQTFPGSEAFDRPFRLRPVPVDTRPPSSR